MKLLPIEDMIRGQKLLFCEDSIVRGTQMKNIFKILRQDMGAEEIHVRSASPPILFNCKFLNFAQSRRNHELVACRAIAELEGVPADSSLPTEVDLRKYCDPNSKCYQCMVEKIAADLQLTTLKYQTLDDLIAAIGLPREKLCTYCWTGEE